MQTPSPLLQPRSILPNIGSVPSQDPLPYPKTKEPDKNKFRPVSHQDQYKHLQRSYPLLFGPTSLLTPIRPTHCTPIPSQTSHHAHTPSTKMNTDLNPYSSATPRHTNTNQSPSILGPIPFHPLLPEHCQRSSLLLHHMPKDRTTQQGATHPDSGRLSTALTEQTPPPSNDLPQSQAPLANLHFSTPLSPHNKRISHNRPPQPSYQNTKRSEHQDSLLGPRPPHFLQPRTFNSTPHCRHTIAQTSSPYSTPKTLLHPLHPQAPAMGDRTRPDPASEEELIAQFADLLKSPVTIPCLDLDHSHVSNRKWGSSLLLKVLTDKPYSDQVFISTIARGWKSPVPPTIYHIPGDLFVAEFDNPSDRDRIYDQGPWHFRRDLILLSKLSGPPTDQDRALNYADIWIQLHNLPLDILNYQGVLSLASQLGVPLPSHSSAANKWTRFARLKISIPINKPLTDRLHIRLPNSQITTVHVCYEKIYRLCLYCGHLGHETDECTQRNSLLVLLSTYPLHVQQKLQDNLEPALGSWITKDYLLPQNLSLSSAVTHGQSSSTRGLPQAMHADLPQPSTSNLIPLPQPTPLIAQTQAEHTISPDIPNQNRCTEIIQTHPNQQCSWSPPSLPISLLNHISPAIPDHTTEPHSSTQNTVHDIFLPEHQQQTVPHRPLPPAHSLPARLKLPSNNTKHPQSFHPYNDSNRSLKKAKAAGINTPPQSQ